MPGAESNAGGSPMPPGTIQGFTKENVNVARELAKKFKPLIENKSETVAEETRQFFKDEHLFPGADYARFEEILADSKNPNLTSEQKNKLDGAIELIGSAAVLANNNMFEWATKGEMGSHFADNWKGLDEAVNRNIFVDGPDDVTGKLIVEQLKQAEIANRLVQRTPDLMGTKNIIERCEGIENTLSGALNRAVTKDVELDVEESRDTAKLSLVYAMVGENLGKLKGGESKVGVEGMKEAVKQGMKEGMDEVVDIYERYARNAGEIETGIGEARLEELFGKEGLGELPDELKEKLVKGGRIRRSELSGLDEGTQDRVMKLERDLQNIKAGRMAREEALRERKKSKGEKDVNTVYKLDYIFDCINHIEGNGFKSDDLTRNSRQLFDIYMVQMEHINNVTIEETIKGKRMERKLTYAELELLRTEIGMRMFSHDSYLAMSRCREMDDYVRTLSTLYEGDDGTTAQKLVRFMLELPRDKEGRPLKRGAGLKEVPIDLAWNLRQLGYFEIEGLTNEVRGANWFLENIRRGVPLKEGEASLLDQILKEVNESMASNLKKVADHLKEYNKVYPDQLSMTQLGVEMAKGRAIDYRYFRFVMAEALWPEVEIEADAGVALYENVYKNFWLMEEDGEKKSLRYKIFKEYMIEDIQRLRYGDEAWLGMKGVEGRVGQEKEARDRAETAFKLAREVDVVLKGRPRADIKKNVDKYSQLINAWYTRIGDNRVGPEKGLPPKSKVVGGISNIRFIWAMVPYWLEACRKEGAKNLKTPYEVLFAEDIDPNKIGARSDMLWYVSQLEASQALPLYEILTNPDAVAPDKVKKAGFFNSLGARIDKLLSQGFMEARIYPTTYTGDDWYEGWKSGATNEQKKKSLRIVSDEMKGFFADNLFLMMKGMPEYKLADYFQILSTMKRNEFATRVENVRIRNKETGKMEGVEVKKIGAPFTRKDILDRYIKATGVEAAIKAHEKQQRDAGATRWKPFG